MLDRPMKRICPSLIASILAKTLRQRIGLNNGSTPSNTSIRASAPSKTSATLAAAYFFGAGAPLELEPRMALK